MSAAKIETAKQPGSIDVLWKSRWAVRLLFGLAFIVATCSLVLFGYQIWMRDAFTGDLVRDQQGAWLRLTSHLVRAGAAAWLMVRAWHFLGELKAVRNSSEPDCRPIFTAIARGLNATSWSCLILWSLGILSVIDATYGLPSIQSLSPRSSIPFAPEQRREVKDVKIEFREAQFEPREAWVRSSVTVTETVAKPVYLRDHVIVKTSDIVEATATAEEYGPALRLHLSKDGAEKLLAWSTTLVDKHIAIVVDDVVISVPIVKTPMSESVLLIGGVTFERAQEIADSINGKR